MHSDHCDGTWNTQSTVYRVFYLLFLKTAFRLKRECGFIEKDKQQHNKKYMNLCVEHCPLTIGSRNKPATARASLNSAI